MLYLWFCISQQHEHRLVLLAALLCMAGSIAAILLLRQARDARKGGTALDGAERWLAMAGRGVRETSIKRSSGTCCAKRASTCIRAAREPL